MPPRDTGESQEAPRDAVEIKQDQAISVQEALIIAGEENFPIGKSTLQRWAKAWGEQNNSPVKSLLFATRNGSAYRLDRDDFKAWLFDQKQNMRPGETPRGPVMSHETQQDPTRSREASQDSARFNRREDDSDLVDKLHDENMQLKIDVEVRKQLLNQAKGEIDRQRDHIEGLLRENGGLQSQLLQLSAGRDQTPLPLDAPVPQHPTTVDNQRPIDAPGYNA